jgi:predicted PurR-regulated permease PerM
MRAHHELGERRERQMSLLDTPRAWRAAFLALLAVLALAGVLAILRPFIGPLVLAGALSITTYPVYRRMGERWPRLSPTLRALVTDLGILMLVLVPIVLVIWTAAEQADAVRPALARWTEASLALHDARLDSLGYALMGIPATGPRGRPAPA